MYQLFILQPYLCMLVSLGWSALIAGSALSAATSPPDLLDFHAPKPSHAVHLSNSITTSQCHATHG
jgi:hypothetical protein